jgi:hypothetical protein
MFWREIGIIPTLNQIKDFTRSNRVLTAKIKVMRYTKLELMILDTIEQAWDGDELKIQEDGLRVWFTYRENRAYNGDYTVETLVDGKWE